MAINKVIYGGETLIDLTGDTVTPEQLKKGIKAHDKSGAVITGTCTHDVDSTDATATAAEILKGKTAYARGTKQVGSMPNNGAISGTINSKDGVYTVPMGYHDGSGKVQIDETEKAKLIPANVREGVTLLGVEGAMSGTEDAKPQAKTVTPSTSEQTILPDEGYNYLSQVTVEAIPYAESENSAGGTTVTIAG
ncbi:MAG: hypothetical protein KH921_07350 [Erysipelotrichaceae bacterium]|nr:hypothetical protein [Erysipelotrichaceae bacterium]